MSWFDTSGLANIAKSALKEAQRTIDKALDIKEEDLNQVPVNTPIDTNSEDFFGSWGLVQSKEMTKQKSEEIVTKSPVKTSTSLWGSFTGSFFDSSKENFKSKDSVESLDDSVDLVLEPFSSSKLVVQPIEEPDVNLFRMNSVDQSDLLVDVAPDTDTSNDVKRRDKEKPLTSHINRLSIVSCESSKNSSESVEIVSNTECTTSPDSEALSLGQCVSSSSSIMGSKPNSESVEVIMDSLASPSSVEVLDSNCSSRRESQYTNEFVSPLQSPEEIYSIPEKDTPDSVEVIPDDQEESSVAEDTVSYTSVSESTSATVLESAFNLHVKPPKSSKDSLNRGDTISELSPDKSSQDPPVTKAPSRGGMHLPIIPSVANLIDTQPQSSKLDMLDLLKNTNVIDIPLDGSDTVDGSDEGFQSDKTLVPGDSAMESSSDTSTTTDSNANSLYVTNMLADAMTENKGDPAQAGYDLSTAMIDSSIDQKSELENISISELDMPPRETSPISSGSRSDLVKIGSSGHTSGDELETTTSSDIEIISSPNGDSSSTHSRHSPAKLLGKPKLDANVDALLCKMTLNKIKGHNRELSEASSISDDSELDKLLKRLSEMTDILESREAKLIEVSRRNAELQEINGDYRQQLDVIFKNQMESLDVHQVTEEYTQRLSALERKFQQAIREKDILRKQLDQCKQDAVTRMTKAEMDTLMADKDEVIKELREEGEKLSKQQLQHSTIIKKLRAKEKENEATIKHLKEKIEDLTTESDRMKKSLSAKEEVERTQIEAVHHLTEKNKKLDNEVAHLKEQVDDISQKYETTKKSLDAAKKELVDKNRATNELQTRQQMVQSLEKEKQNVELQNEELLNQVDDLRSKLRQSDQDMLKKEQNIRAENNELVRRVEDAERRNEELSQSLLEVSKPLVQQIDSLQASHNKKVTNLEKVEQTLSLKLNETQSKLQSAKEAEKAAKDECIGLRTKVSLLEGQLNSALHDVESMKMEVEKKDAECMLKQNELKRENDQIKEDLNGANSSIENLKTELQTLKQKLERAIQQSNAQQEPPKAEEAVMSLPNTRNTSPTLSLGKISLSESMSSSFWPPEDMFDLNQSSRCTNMLEMQLIQTNLKARDGEVQQLHWELKRREHERTILNTEISDLLSRVETLEEKLVNHEALNVQFGELQQQYDTLCQLYGEKVEETEELKLDLQDVKDMYKSQIDELLKQQKNKN